MGGKEMTIDDLKCCGNCNNRDTIQMVDYHREVCGLGMLTCCHEICSKWEFDNLVNSDRQIKEG